MRLPLRYYGDPVLRKKAKPIEEITPAIKKLVDDMIETMHFYSGVGLAAPQVGELICLFVAAIREEGEDESIPIKPLVYINPKVTIIDEAEDLLPEGCLSIPLLRYEVKRPIKVKVEALDLEGNPFVEEVTHWKRRVILHENDHLNGILFIDRMNKKERKKIDPMLRKIKREYASSSR